MIQTGIILGNVYGENCEFWVEHNHDADIEAIYFGSDIIYDCGRPYYNGPLLKELGFVCDQSWTNEQFLELCKEQIIKKDDE